MSKKSTRAETSRWAHAQRNLLGLGATVTVLLLGASLSLTGCGAPAGTGGGEEENVAIESAPELDEVTESASLSSASSAACLGLGTCTNNRTKCCTQWVTRNKSCSTTFSCCAPANTWVRSVKYCCSGKAYKTDGHGNISCW